MVELNIEGESLLVSIKGLHKVWALKRRIEIPLSSIVAIRADPEAAGGWWHGLRLGGTQIPGLFTAGTFYYKDKWVFYDVRRPENAVVIELEGHRYDQLVLEVRDPPEAIARVEEALRAA